MKEEKEKPTHLELKKIQDEISVLKKDLFSKKEVKEKFFSQGENYFEQINKLYEEVKEIEKNHNLEELNLELKKSKENCEELKVELVSEEKNFEDIRINSKKNLNKNFKKDIDSKKKLEEKEKLEFKLQTQVSTLKEEADINKKIQEINCNLLETNKSDEYTSAKKKLNSIRKKFFLAEKEIRSLYKKIRLASKEKKVKYSQIKEIKVLKKNAYDEFRKIKKECLELSKNLQEKFENERKILEDLGENQPKETINRQLKHNIKKAQMEVEEKLSKKKELTTEDFLILQAKK